MKTLARLDLDEKTLVVFCSDNGPVLDDGYEDGAVEKIGDHRAAGQYSGGKYSIYEGGTRTPLITRWPGKIKPGVSDELVCTIDFAGSFASLVGEKLGDDDCVDSFNVMDAMLGAPNGKGRSSLVQQDNGARGNFGYRSGNWKLHRHDKKSARNVKVEQKLANKKVPQFQLFDLATDPSETKNVMDENSEIGEKMKAELAKIIADGRSR